MYKYLLVMVGLLPLSAYAVEYLVVTADSVRVREQPSLNGRSMLMLNTGHLVIKIEEKGDWTRIYFTGKESQTGKTEGWMYSPFLKEEKAHTNASKPEEFQLSDNFANLTCEKVIGTELVQGCDLLLQYSLQHGTNLKRIKVNCSAELVAKSRSGELIPVPVNQTLEHQVVNVSDDYSMHILMKADVSYELSEVSLEGHRCQLVRYSK